MSFFYLLFPFIISAKLKVFLILHSHNDAGWLKTVDEYYINSTQYIISNMISLLESKPFLKFSWAETYFLSRYLSENPDQKPTVASLISQNRLEIVGGGWVQNDEALPDYELTLRQMQIGFSYLKSELNVSKIKTGWQLDPFGHSSLTAALWEKMGFESLVISRVEENIRSYLELTGNCEFIWKGEGFSASKGILTHVLNDHYYPPVFLDYQPWNDHCCYRSLPAKKHEVLDCIKKLEIYVNSTQSKYKSNNHMMLIGGDFFYSNLNETASFLGLLDEIIQNSQNIEIQYATPSDYFAALHEDKKKFKVFKGDMLPLISRGSPYNKAWTGFYSYLPELKNKIINLQKISRAHEIVLSGLRKPAVVPYNLALFTHHDVITCTSRAQVISDFFNKARTQKKTFYQSFARLFREALGESEEKESQIEVPFKLLFLFNPLDWTVEKTLYLYSEANFLQIIADGEYLEVQSVPWEEGFRFFYRYKLKGFTLKVVFIREFSEYNTGCNEISEVKSGGILKNQYIEIDFKSGLLTSVKYLGKKHEFNTTIMNYATNQSGQYTFIPYREPRIIGRFSKFFIYSGNLVQVAEAVIMIGSQRLVQRAILFSDSKEFYLNLKLAAPNNSDIFLRFNKDYSEDPWFYLFNTANIMKKHLKYDGIFRKGNNYYPINGAFFIDLHSDFLYLVPSFPVSAGIPSQSSFEVSLNRLTVNDDGLGLSEVIGNSVSVEHDWLIGFNAPYYDFIYKKYLEHRHQPISLFDVDQDLLVDDFSLATTHKESWKLATSYSFFAENDCSHVVSLESSGHSYLASVFNLCENPAEYPFDVSKEASVGGMEVDFEQKSWNADDEIKFMDFNNSGDNVLGFKHLTGRGMIGSFELVSFYTDLKVTRGGLAVSVGQKFIWGMFVLGIAAVFFFWNMQEKKKNPIYQV